MAGDWIAMRLDLALDPAVVLISARLGISRQHVVGSLHSVWSWFDANTENGSAKDVPSMFVDELAGLGGFAEAMSEVDWLHTDNGSVSLPRFTTYMGESAKRRLRRNRSQAQWRSGRGPDVDSCVDTHVDNPVDTPLSTNRSTTEQNRTEQNRREEENPPTPLWGKGQIRLNSESAQWEGITKEIKQGWTEAFPAVGVELELRQAAQWCLANPAKGRKSNYRRFLTNWMQRHQDQGGSRQTQEKPHELTTVQREAARGLSTRIDHRAKLL